MKEILAMVGSLICGGAAFSIILLYLISGSF